MDDLEKTIQEFAVEQGKLITRVDLLTDQVQETKKLIESVHALALSVEKLTEQQKNMSIQLNKLQSNVDEIQSKPAKRWDLVISVALTAIVTAAITLWLK